MQLQITTIKGHTFTLNIITKEETVVCGPYDSCTKEVTKFKTDCNIAAGFNNWFWSAEDVQNMVSKHYFYKTVKLVKS